MITDAVRLKWLMDHSGIDGFAGISIDRHDLALEVAVTHGRDEPTQQDELDGFRFLIDLAIISTPEQEHP